MKVLKDLNHANQMKSLVEWGFEGDNKLRLLARRKLNQTSKVFASEEWERLDRTNWWHVTKDGILMKAQSVERALEISIVLKMREGDNSDTKFKLPTKYAWQEEVPQKLKIQGWITAQKPIMQQLCIWYYREASISGCRLSCQPMGIQYITSYQIKR